jgi:hypothetical protein
LYDCPEFELRRISGGIQPEPWVDIEVEIRHPNSQIDRKPFPFRSLKVAWY